MSRESVQVLDRLDLTDFTVQSVLLSGLPQGLASTVCPGHDKNGDTLKTVCCNLNHCILV